MMGIYLLYIIPLVFIQTVFGAPELSFSVNKSVLEFQTGESVSVYCSISGASDGSTLEWYDNNGVQVINRDSRVYPYIMELDATRLLLYLGEATKEMAGTYKCKGITSEGDIEKEIRIEVKASLEFENCPENQFGIYEMQSTVKCSVTGNAVTFWNRDPPFPKDEKEKENYLLESDSVKIFNTSMLDQGKYKYIAMAGEKTKFRIIEFSVYTKPEIVQPLLQTTAIVGRKASLFCKAKGIPDPQIEWRKAGSTKVLETGDRIEVIQKKEGDDVQGILNINSVIKEDAAEYSCTAKNLASNEEQDLNIARTTGSLIVQIPPKIETPSNVSEKEGGPAALVCIARGDPPPNLIFVNVKTGESFSSENAEKDIGVTHETLVDPSNLGSKLTLSFKHLKHSDAGEYRCEAKNLAATDEAIFKLEVEYIPKFDNQGPTSFYNWPGNQDAYLKCIANGNPLPSFVWYKGDARIEAGDPYHTVQNKNYGPEKPHTAISELHVTLTGNNDDQVFGEYSCMATNLQGDSRIQLFMVRAEIPGEPSTLDIFKEDARHIEFRLAGPTVVGPEVSFYKVVYKIKGSSEDKPKELVVAAEYRDFIDDSRKYTILSVNDLQPSTAYVFTFHAINDVGTGPGKEFEKTTKAISKPEIPKITDKSGPNSPTSILVMWEKPSDGGSEITEYKVTHQRVQIKKNVSIEGVQDYESESKIGKEQVQDGIKDSPYTVTRLFPSTFYEIKVYARNSVGWSLPGVRIIKTLSDPNYDPTTSGAGSRRDPVKVSMTMFGCLVALCACLKRLM